MSTSTPVAGSLGDFIRETRSQRGLRDYELAARSGISPGQIRNLESGLTTNPSVATLARLAHGLGVDAHALVELSLNSVGRQT